MNNLPVRYPFQLRDWAFINLMFSRKPEVPDNLAIKIQVQSKVEDQTYPDFEVFIRVETQDSEHVSFMVEFVGKYGLVDGASKPDKTLMREFIGERALFQLWSYVSGAVERITGQMGIAPIKLATPYVYGVDQQIEQLSEAS